MRSTIKNYMAMIAVAIVATLVIGAIGVRIDRSQTRSAVDPVLATPIADADPQSMLVDADWLVENKNQVDYIYDLGDLRQYQQGHIPGASHIWWQDAMNIGPEEYSVPDVISSLTSQASIFGILNLHIPQDASVVLYDSNGSENATWLLWTMKINGYTNVRVLDGGLAAWIGAGGELSTDGAQPVDTSIEATPVFLEDFYITTESLQVSPDAILIDTRDTDQMKDTVNGTVREGHIPGAINIATSEVMHEDGTFRSAEELRSLFESWGITENSDIVVYSLFPHQSGNLWLALHLAGFDQARIYISGYAAWGANADLPISTESFSTPAAPATPVVTTPAPTQGPTVTPTGTTTPTPRPTIKPTVRPAGTTTPTPGT